MKNEKMNEELLDYFERHYQARDNYLDLLEFNTGTYYVLEVRDEKQDIVCYTYTDRPAWLYERAFYDRPKEEYDSTTGKVKRKTQAHSYYIPQVLFRGGYYTMHLYKDCSSDKRLAKQVSRELTGQNNSLLFEAKRNREISSLDEQLFC